MRYANRAVGGAAANATAEHGAAAFAAAGGAVMRYANRAVAAAANATAEHGAAALAAAGEAR